MIAVVSVVVVSVVVDSVVGVVVDRRVYRNFPSQVLVLASLETFRHK